MARVKITDATPLIKFVDKGATSKVKLPPRPKKRVKRPAKKGVPNSQITLDDDSLGSHRKIPSQSPQILLAITTALRGNHYNYSSQSLQQSLGNQCGNSFAINAAIPWKSLLKWTTLRLDDGIKILSCSLRLDGGIKIRSPPICVITIRRIFQSCGYNTQSFGSQCWTKNYADITNIEIVIGKKKNAIAMPNGRNCYWEEEKRI